MFFQPHRSAGADPDQRMQTNQVSPALQQQLFPLQTVPSLNSPLESTTTEEVAGLQRKKE